MNWYRTLLNILFPAICAGCELNRIDEAASQLLCNACMLDTKPITALHCPVCRGRIPLYYSRNLLRRANPCHPKADYTLLSTADYSNPIVRNLIRKLKFSRHSKISAYLGEHAATIAQPISDSIDCIIPIPLSAARYRERGFNQAELIAQEIATRIGKPCQTDVLVRIKNTKAQSTLRGTRARQKNLQGSFIIRKPETIQGKRILLVDDVWTTGSTMNIAAQTLKTAEPKSIIALVIARA